ncbi:DUF4167 domain-containing protein [Croceicoccus gelatinilyticus]|uniref:DUF4167 domain-containing protein n=1 Tax=Croceicoccus gelatinilyticus TaxID=2835536 RepID=UPI001BCCF17F|nr:DUF4167 domain-containing protein [Croceicoccus gelatinilyticus]MBS7669637.1 DUF4167 domain-containing protein [Croceicoccus gelatinilyticus]
MNNNRGNNRRRGRNNRSQGGGQHLNRIDSRARGNAPQLLDKYKKLAEEAHRNGDRVQAEYYLQFADHYFRVIADGKARQEEQRQKRDDDRSDRQSDDDNRGQNNDNDSENDGEEEEETSNRRQRRRKDGGDENPFTRDSRQRRPRRNRDDEESSEDTSETEKSVDNDGGLDPQALPPAIGETEEKPKRRGRPRKVKAETSDDDDVKQAVNG